MRYLVLIVIVVAGVILPWISRSLFSSSLVVNNYYFTYGVHLIFALFAGVLVSRHHKRAVFILIPMIIISLSYYCGYLNYSSEIKSYALGEFEYPSIIPENYRAINHDSYWSYVNGSHLNLKTLVVGYVKLIIIWLASIVLMSFVIKKLKNESFDREIIDN